MKKDQLIKELKKLYPYGHPNFIELAVNCMELHSQKNHDYAKGGNPLGNFNRVSEITLHVIHRIMRQGDEYAGR